MRGLTVRWSLVDAPPETADKLATYVETSSHARFTGMAGLRFKVWRCRPGEWFEGSYVFVTEEACAEFQRSFSDTAGESPGSQIIGTPPVLIEAWDVVAVAEGWDGFESSARG